MSEYIIYLFVGIILFLVSYYIFAQFNLRNNYVKDAEIKRDFTIINIYKNLTQSGYRCTIEYANTEERKKIILPKKIPVGHEVQISKSIHSQKTTYGKNTEEIPIGI